MISKLTYASYLDVLHQTHQHPKQSYLHKSLTDNTLKIFSSKAVHQENQHRYIPLNYRQIVLLGICFKERIQQDKKDAKLVIEELQRMREQKIEKMKKQPLLIVLISVVWDCFQNWKDGYQWKRTFTLELEFTNALRVTSLSTSSDSSKDETSSDSTPSDHSSPHTDPFTTPPRKGINTPTSAPKVSRKRTAVHREPSGNLKPCNLADRF